MSALDWNGLLEEICSLIKGWLKDETYVKFHERDRRVGKANFDRGQARDKEGIVWRRRRKQIDRHVLSVERLILFQVEESGYVENVGVSG